MLRVPTVFCTSISNVFGSQIRTTFLPPKVPQKLLYKHQYTPVKTPEHHNNPEVERLLKEELQNYPPYQSRLIRTGFQDAIMVRDYKRRQVAAHFSDLRLRLNALRKNSLLPKEIQDLATVQIASLPRDSNWTRILARCVLTSRRRGCKVRWRISRIMWRRFADYNRMSGVLWALWSSQTMSTRKHLKWPPPENLSTDAYLMNYHKNLRD